MNEEKNTLIETDQSIYLYVVNTASLLKTLKKNNIANNETQELAKNAALIHSSFSEISNHTNKIPILKEIEHILEKNLQILIENFEEINNQVIHEKANLLIDTNKLKKNIILLQTELK